jgi:hypothetical protein
MIEYALRNSAGDLIKLNDATIDNPVKGSTSLGPDNFTFENKIVEKSSLPGSVQLGQRRTMARPLNLFFNRANQTDSTFRSRENSLIMNLEDTEYLADVTNNRQVPVSVLDYNLEYDKGAYHHSSDNLISFLLLEPFWTSLTVTTLSQSLIIDVNEITITELGYLPIPPILTFTANVPVTKLQIYIANTNQGIQIEDDLFGTTNYGTLVVNCVDGTVKLGSVDRINSVVPGTGFFRIPTGQNTLNVVPSAACSIKIDRYKREYI